MKNHQGAILTAILGFGVIQSVVSYAATVPHPDDPSKSREHLALFALAPESAATHRVFQSGEWSSIETWDDPATAEDVEPPPGDGARVVVPAGITLTVDGVIPARLSWILVNGKLRFSQANNTELNVESIIVDPNGTYEQGTFEAPARGTVDAPIAPHVKSVVRFIDSGEIDREYDPFGLSRGLISHGVAAIHGAYATPYAFLAKPARAGDAVIHLASEPINWELGERIVVPGVDSINGLPQGMSQGDLDEQFTIEAINFNPETGDWDVALNRALVFDHVPPMFDSGEGGPAPAFRIPVAYLHRNVIYVSENSATGRRGHVMFMHNPGVSVANALFEQLGRTDALQQVTDPQVDAFNVLDPETTGNDRGRYSLHVHRTVPDPTKRAKISGVCVINSPKLGIVNHDSCVDVEDSVVFDAAGSGFFTEIGTELGTFHRCLAIHTMRGTGEMEDRFRHTMPGGADFGFNGVGFWLQGGGVAVTDCMAFNSRREGFVAETVTLTIDGALTRFAVSNLENPAWAVNSSLYYAPGNDGFVGVDEVALRKFEGNLTVAAVTGLVVRKHNPIGRPTEIKDFKAFNVSARGIGADYGGPMTFRNVTLQGGTVAYPGTYPWRSGNAWKGITMNASNKGFVFENVDIRRFEVGLHYVNNWDGLINYIRNSRFDNILNIEVFQAPFAEAAVYIENVTFNYNTPLLNDPSNPRSNVYHDIVLTAFPGRPGSQVWWTEPAESGTGSATQLLFPTTGSISYKLNPERPDSAPILESVISRKTHGPAGAIDLYLPVLSGVASVEGRSGGATGSHHLILTFDRLLAEGSVEVTSGNPEISVVPVINENRLILNFTGVADQQWVEFTLSGLTDVDGNVLEPSQGVPELIPTPHRVIGFFQGDTNADAVVNEMDLSGSQVSPGPTDSRTFRADINSDGFVNFLDVQAIAAGAGNVAGDSHLLRYALGLNLNASGGDGLPTTSVEGANLAFYYSRAVGAVDLTYKAMWSDDLKTWSIEGIVTDIISNDGKVQQLRAKVPLNGAAQKYMRLEVDTR